MTLKEKLYCVSGFITLIGNRCSYHQSCPKMGKKNTKKKNWWNIFRIWNENCIFQGNCDIPKKPEDFRSYSGSGGVVETG